MYWALFDMFEVAVVNEHAHTEGSADNVFPYDLAYRHPDDDMRTSAYGIKVYRDGDLFRTAIVMAAGGATGPGEDSALVDGQNLVLTCCNKVFSLRLPDLGLNWVVEADWATCFSIYLYKDSYIVHGELVITRLDRSGNIIWQAGGGDIFVVNGDCGPAFEMQDDHIALMDWEGRRYRLSYEGKITGA